MNALILEYRFFSSSDLGGAKKHLCPQGAFHPTLCGIFCFYSCCALTAVYLSSFRPPTNSSSWANYRFYLRVPISLDRSRTKRRLSLAPHKFAANQIYLAPDQLTGEFIFSQRCRPTPFRIRKTSTMLIINKLPFA
jgi:hypothetical protein